MTLFALLPASSPSRDPATVAFATYSSFHSNQLWVESIAREKVSNANDILRDHLFIHSKNFLKKLPKNLANLIPFFPRFAATGYPYLSFLSRASAIRASFSNLESTLTPARVTHFAKGWVPDPKGRFFLITTSLLALNTLKFFKDMSNEPKWIPKKEARTHVKNQANDFLAVVWRATPYLMIITNIAVTVLRIYQGGSAEWVTLAVTGVTLLPITNLMPESFSVCLSMCGIPIDLAAFWYGDYDMRKSILIGLIFRGIF
ncbi:MAG TPA: hypothetical protein VFU89_03845 [Rhabdochlamydiaceae bacterium]|nr:hypothetical protein [Rhabdochlamydiaceae bacterium]